MSELMWEGANIDRTDQTKNIGMSIAGVLKESSYDELTWPQDGTVLSLSLSLSLCASRHNGFCHQPWALQHAVEAVLLQYAHLVARW
jgi:hypothetical protein